MLAVYGYQLIVRSVAQSVSVNTDGVEWPYSFCRLVEMNKGENQIYLGFLGARTSPRLVSTDRMSAYKPPRCARIGPRTAR